MRLLLIGFAAVLVGLGACGDGGTKGQGESCVTSGDCEGALICDATSKCVVDPNPGGLTPCSLGFAVTNEGGKDFGEVCDTDSECRYGVCLKPGTAGNITNTQFGFCSRGCDCGESVASRLTAEEKNDFACLYPAGAASMHHVLLLCDAVEDCKAVEEGYTSCQMPNTGGARRVCHAL